jgi:hypothetical protein
VSEASSFVPQFLRAIESALSRTSATTPTV